jgi:3-isopropylmalate dehydrogenase
MSESIQTTTSKPLLSRAVRAVNDVSIERGAPNATSLSIGILPGEGVGPDVIRVVKDLLAIVANHGQLRFDIHTGGDIGTIAEKSGGEALSREVIEFCESIFDDGGVLLCGPGGGRFVYDLRAHFDLFCKLTPIHPFVSLQDTGVLRPEAVSDVDMVIVRENTSGLYFSKGTISQNEAIHTFRNGRKEVQRILEVAVRLAEMRRGKLSLAVKTSAVKEASQFWTGIFHECTAGKGLQTEVLQVDNANYQIIAAAQTFDVLVAPNMFGDILSDGAALLLGSRGMSFSGNYSPSGHAVYQTAHGAAHDLAGTDTANPIGQILSAAMMLRESFNLTKYADAIEAAVDKTLASGIRTVDIAATNSQLVGSRAMGQHIATALEGILMRG